MSQRKIIDIESQYKDILLSNCVIPSEQKSFQIWRRIHMKNQTFTSLKATETKSIDYFVRMKNGKMGKVVFFFEKNSVVHLLLNTYELNFKNHHWLEITDEKCFAAYPCTDIDEKLLYFKIGSIEYVTQEPNTFGKCCY